MREDVTVVIPAYQAEHFLPVTLATVAAQTVLPAELIVVDDGSADGTCQTVESFASLHSELSVRLLHQRHRGPGAARNAGVRAAHTQWIAFLDSDDLWCPEKLATMLEAVRAHPEGNFFCHNETIHFLDGSTRVTHYGATYSHEEPLPRQLYRNNYFSTSAVVCRRDLVLRWNGFDETLSSAQDYELWLRMSPDIAPVFVPQVLGTYVLREGNITTSRFWTRLINMLRVKHRHRAKAGWLLYVIGVASAVFYHLARPVHGGIKGFFKRAAGETS